jgi:hypothetical protein
MHNKVVLNKDRINEVKLASGIMAGDCQAVEAY